MRDALDQTQEVVEVTRHCGAVAGRLLLAVGVLLIAAGAPALCEDPCFEDVSLRGWGTWWQSRTVEFSRMYNSRPEFAGSWGYVGDVEWEVLLQYNAGFWILRVTYNDRAVPGFCIAYYTHAAADDTPPLTGWQFAHAVGDEHPDFLDLGGPTLWGGWRCGEGPVEEMEPRGELLPAAAAGFLDRGLPDDKEPVVVGELPVAAIYEAGELISGCCQPVDAGGAPADTEFLTLSWYAVTIGEEYDVREAIDSKIVRAGDAVSYTHLRAHET